MGKTAGVRKLFQQRGSHKIFSLF